MEKTAIDLAMPADLSGFYLFLRRQYRFSEGRIRGIIACTGAILNKVQNLTMSRADLERIRHYIKGIGLTGDTINFYLTSFIFYMKYIESAGQAIDQVRRGLASDQDRSEGAGY